MPRQLTRLRETRKSDTFDDQKNASQITLSESSSAHHQELFDCLLSQIKRIIYGSRTGNWNDDVTTVFGSDASLASLVGGNGFVQDTEIDDVSPTAFFIGKAALGSDTSSAVWQIRRFTKSLGDVVDVFYAEDSAAYDKVWDNRYSYDYGTSSQFVLDNYSGQLVYDSESSELVTGDY